MRFVLDTSVFTNRSKSGMEPEEVVERISSIAKSHELFIPKSVAKEISNFVDIKGLRKAVRIRDPARLDISIPAIILYEFIAEMRERINKGLRLAERAARHMSGKDIRELREKYRKYLREGIIDSKEDVDVLLLAKEVGGIIVTSDRGIMDMAGKMGLEYMDAKEFLDSQS